MRWILSDRVRLLIHDFQPDAEESLTWLAEAARRMRVLEVFALLPAPASVPLDLLVRTSLPFDMVGVALAGEVAPDALSERLLSAVVRAGYAGLRDALARELDLDPALSKVVAAVVRMRRPPTTVERLVQVSGHTRKELVRLSKSSGFSGPGELLRVLRSLMALHLMRRGLRVEQAAEATGYASADRFRLHGRELFDDRPSVLAHFPDEALLRRCRPA